MEELFIILTFYSDNIEIYCLLSANSYPILADTQEYEISIFYYDIFLVIGGMGYTGIFLLAELVDVPVY